MTVQIGSEGFTLPVSDTEPCTLSQIFDLESTSSIKAVVAGQYGLAEGDYVLVQSGESDPSTIKVDEVELDELSGTTSVTELDEFRGSGAGRTTVDANGTPTSISLKDNDVTRELVSLERAEVSVDIDFKIAFRSNNFYGEVIIEPGYKAVFDPSWTLTIQDSRTAEFLRMTDGHTAVFTKEMPVSVASALIGRLHLEEVDFSKTSGQGLVAPGRFSLECDVNTSGQVSIGADQLAAGQTALVELVTTTTPNNAKILAVTGIVDPKIDIEPTGIEINDIPDCLSEEGNVLDIENPRIAFTVYNSSPVDINLNATLSAVDRNGVSRQTMIGDANGTAPIVIRGGRTTEFVLSRRPLQTAGAENIVVEDLGELISTIPDRFDFDNIVAKALPEVVTMQLGMDYTYDCDYEAVVPLAFGADLRLLYKKDDCGWNEDLYKYNFNQVQVTVDVVSTMPMDLAPSVTALDAAGNEIDDISAVIEGSVAPGTIEQPATSPLKIVLSSTAENLGRLDGIRMEFEGTTDAAHVGKNLNKAQSLEFNNIRIKIIGGVTVDLN
ncbi:MAG: hypothetical protein K2I56_04580 [Muribaculaceae bacterium]|nr:hypothetical protein [Muribaculaceae bacterium]